MNMDFDFETHAQKRQRMARESEGFQRFRTLWSAYCQALSVPFSLDREEDARIKSEVERCFEALNNLAKEGA